MIVDYARDDASRQITEKLRASKYFEIENRSLSHNQIEETFREGKVKLAVIFPFNFSRDLRHFNSAQLQIIADASDPNTASTLTNYLTSIVLDYQAGLSGNQTVPIRIETETRMLYNPQLNGAHNFVPGVMALVLMLVCVMMTSVSIVREKELGTMEILLVSPIKPSSVIVSKAIPYLLLIIDKCNHDRYTKCFRFGSSCKRQCHFTLRGKYPIHNNLSGAWLIYFG
ncbi:MAG: ABC transporter permease [Cyclobacteriaceae bacterium]